jgi:hypothetical protein
MEIRDVKFAGDTGRQGVAAFYEDGLFPFE